MEPPHFQRSPRLSPEIPGGEVEIPEPEQAPVKPALAIGYLVPAAVGALFSIALPLFLSGRVPGSSSYGITYLIFSAPLTLASCMVPVLGYLAGNKAYQRASLEREIRYRSLLQKWRTELGRSWAQQQAAMRELNPELAECLRRVLQRDIRMWERSPADADFLHLRLGTGAIPFAVKIRLPGRRQRLTESDSLCEEAAALAAEFSAVPSMPVTAALGDLGMVGVAGERSLLFEQVRTMMLHLATHHSPDEVKIAAIFPEEEVDRWSWLRWLPHVWSDDGRQRYLAGDREAAHRLLKDLHEILSRRRGTRQEGQGHTRALPVFVLLLIAPEYAENTPAMSLLLTEQKAVGAYSIVLVSERAELPRECGAIIDLAGGSGELIRVDGSVPRVSYKPDGAALDLCEYFSRTMAPIRLRRSTTPLALPTSLPLFDLFGAIRLEDLEVLERWNTSEPGQSLAVPIGFRAGGELLCLDLHEKGHGPHGLVAGATGSGKSELLQTIIASLAVHFHPHDLAFILVDYKGGALANSFRDLPHLIGSITNLQGNLASRALAALKGEVRRRQALIGQASVNHVDDYQLLYREGRVSEPLPHLVFVVDEFAELKAEQPDFMRELISAVRVGRSLGIHLILATQKPAGVVDEQIWSNSRFRLCLRVERPEDSREVLKRPEAAFLTTPGRAYFQVGHDDLFDLFQAAWGGAPYVPAGPATSTAAVAEVVLDGHRYPLSSQPRSTAGQGPQWQALVTHLAAVAREASIPRLPGPWLPPLPEQLELGALARECGWDGQNWQPTSGWLEPAIGLVDDPGGRRQETLRLPLGKEGHLAVFGTPGTGKTTFLQTLVTGLALAHSPAEVQLYLLDFGGRVLSLFSGLPHVGAVILGDEEERFTRLLSHMLKELERRKDAFGMAGVTTLTAYRRATADPLAAIVIVVDNFPALTESYPDGEEVFMQIAREGSSFGIHLVITANAYSSVRTKVAGNILLTVALHQNDRSDYAMIVGRTGGLEPMSLPGRGLVRGTPPLEFQTALPCSGETEVDRLQTLRAMARAMDSAWTGIRPKPMNTLPDVVPLASLLASARAGAPAGETVEPRTAAVPVGISAQSLEPLVVDLRDGPHFLIAGPSGSGKTTLLQSWLLSLALRLSPDQLMLYLVDFSNGELGRLKSLQHVRKIISTDHELTAALAELNQSLSERRQALLEVRQAGGGPDEIRRLADAYPRLVLAIDDYDSFRDGTGQTNERELERLVQKERGLGLHLLTAAGADEIISSYDSLSKALKEARTGFILGRNSSEDVHLLNGRLPAAESGKLLPPGLGYYGRRGRLSRFRVATPHTGPDSLHKLIHEITSRTEFVKRG